jgi:hypothetical protein
LGTAAAPLVRVGRDGPKLQDSNHGYKKNGTPTGHL